MGDEQMSFEQALERLAQIVHELEEGEIGLEQALGRYEEGVKLLRQGYQILEQAEKRIELLTGIGEKGEPLTEPFDATATVDRTNATSKRKGGRARAKSPDVAAAAEEEPNDDAAQLF